MCNFGFRRRRGFFQLTGIFPAGPWTTGRSPWGLWLLALLLPFASLAQPAPPRGERRPLVLILHSYGPGLWVNSLQRGLVQGLSDDPAQVDLYVDFMDTQRIENADYLEQLRQLYALKYRDFHFDLVLACDDNAYLFALAHHRSLWPGTPVVFCGLDVLNPAQLVGQENFTGLSENDDLGPLLQGIPRMLPRVRTLLVISDDSPYA